MPISRAQQPAGLEQAVLETAAELLPGRLDVVGGQGAALGGGPDEPAEEMAVSDVWPLYHLGLDSAVDGTGLAGAQSIGWRALVRVGGRVVALADVDAAAEASTDVRQMTYGPVVSGITEVAEAPRPGGADEDEDDIDQRILQMPGIYLVAVWEHHEANPDADVIVPSAPTPVGVEAGRRYAAAEFLDAIAPIATERAATDPTRAPGSGSGEPPPR